MTKGTTETVRLTVGQAIVLYLQAQYSEYDGERRRLIAAMLGIFGHGNVAGMGQALDEYGDALPYQQTRHEQAMVHTAAGYAKATGRTSTLACTASIGPGSTNMITGAAAATINRLPVLLLPSDYYATRAQGPVLQQLEHSLEADVSVNDCFRPVSRFFDRISRPEQLLASLPEAMRVLTDPAEVGAVTIALPQDVGSHAYDFPRRFFEDRTWTIERRQPSPERLEAAWELIRNAERPMIIAGGGVHYSRATAALEAFSAAAGIPVAETFAGKGALQQRSWRQLGGIGATGNPAANAVANEADLVICVGTRLTDFPTASQSLFQHPDVRFVTINVNAKDAAKQRGLPVVADAKLAITALCDRAVRSGWRTSEQLATTVEKRVHAWQDTRKEAFDSHDHRGSAMTQGQLIGVLNDSARDGDVIVAAAGGPPGDLLKTWDASEGRHAHIEFGFSCMTYEIPAAIGVRMARPAGEIVVFIGDGTYLMGPSELVTARQEGRKITVVIAENHGFQSIWGLQIDRTGRDFGNEFRERSDDHRLDGPYLPLDIAATARGFGARTWSVSGPGALRAALLEARQETVPCVIVVEVEPHTYLPDSGAWMDVEPAAVSGLEEVRSARQRYEERKASGQRFHY